MNYNATHASVSDYRTGRMQDIPDRLGSVRGLTRRGFHRIAYADWGPSVSDRPIVCVHGLTRNGRDFDPLASTIAGTGRRVVCPDLPGRGQSDRLQDGSDYALPQYCSDMTVLIAALGAAEIDWVGTSLGGLIGIVLAALPESPIRRMVINDIGPYLPWSGLLRIGSTLAKTPADFATIEAAEEYFRQGLAPFGQLTDVHWRHLTTHSVRWNSESRRFVTLCDPKIAHAFRNPWQYSIDLWKYWDAIDVPVLVIRGRESDMLPETVLNEMARRNRNTAVLTVEGCGHAPALLMSDQIEVVAEFLDGARGDGARRGMPADMNSQ
jgi:pimeloyl-ACP methyl ester carboxylesterase